MRRLRLALVLPLFLVFAEQGAMLHKLSHTYYSGRALLAQVSDPSGLVDNNQCLECRAFGQIANPVGSAATLPVVKPTTLLPIPDPAYRVATADAPTPRSRGPPLA
jgi:hypothetical protein